MSNNSQITQGVQCLHAYWYLSSIYTYNFKLHTYLWVCMRCVWARPRRVALLGRHPGNSQFHSSLRARCEIRVLYSYFCHRTKVLLVYINVSIHYTRIFYSKKTYWEFQKFNPIRKNLTVYMFQLDDIWVEKKCNKFCWGFWNCFSWIHNVITLVRPK